MARHSCFKVILLAASPALLSPHSSHAVPDERSDLQPQHVRWWTYPSDVRAVVVDKTGRPWCELQANASAAELKAQVERAASMQWPWISGARILLFDNHSRVWLLPQADQKLLLGYNLKTGEWIERKVMPEDQRDGYAEKDSHVPAYVFTGPAFESKDGRLYFGDRIGVHVLDRDQWSYQHLYRQNFEKNVFHGDIKSFNEPVFAEDDRGRVYIWSNWGRFGWSGTIGYFVHDGRSWTQQTEIDGVVLARMSAVVPLKQGRLLLCADAGTAFVTGGDEGEPDSPRKIEEDIRLLSHAEFKQREAAQQRLEARGPRALPLLKEVLPAQTDPEIKERLRSIIQKLAALSARGPLVDGYSIQTARLFGKDARGNAILWCDRVTDLSHPNGLRSMLLFVSPEGKVSPLPDTLQGWYPDSTFADSKGRLWFARYDKGCVALDGEKKIAVTDETQMSFRYVLGEDKEGRVFLSDGPSVVAVQLDWPDPRPSLPTTIYEVPRSETVVCSDSMGRAWAKLAGAHPFLSVFEDGKWTNMKVEGEQEKLEQITYIQPLKNGCVIAQKNPDAEAYFFDGKRWTRHRDLRQAVEQLHALLVDLIDNRRFGRDFYAKLRIDAQKNIWVVEWEKCAVFSGKQWIEVAEEISRKGHFGSYAHCLPFDGGKKMILSNDLLDYAASYVAWIQDGQLKTEPFFPAIGRRSIESDYTTRSGLWLDSKNRVWLPRADDLCIRLDGERQEVMKETGFPRFEDSDGCIWFLNSRRKKLVLLEPGGRRIELEDDALHDTTAVVEDRPRSFWIGTTHGLLHVVKEGGPGAFTLRKLIHYERQVPKGFCLEMFVDRESNLWFYGSGSQNYRLYRVQLPRDGATQNKE